MCLLARFVRTKIYPYILCLGTYKDHQLCNLIKIVYLIENHIISTKLHFILLHIHFPTSSFLYTTWLSQWNTTFFNISLKKQGSIAQSMLPTLHLFLLAISQVALLNQNLDLCCIMMVYDLLSTISYHPHANAVRILCQTQQPIWQWQCLCPPQ